MSVISYNPQINILTQIVKDIEVSYSVRKNGKYYTYRPKYRKYT